MADEVQFTDEQWEAVARAAETFADALDAEQRKLNHLLDVNWAGACAEGEGTMQNLRALLRGDSGSFSQSILSEADYLKSVASQCRASKAALAYIDQDNSLGFRE